MFWARERERKDKIEWMAANIFARVVSKAKPVEWNMPVEDIASLSFDLAEAFVDEAERRAK